MNFISTILFDPGTVPSVRLWFMYVVVNLYLVNAENVKPPNGPMSNGLPSPLIPWLTTQAVCPNPELNATVTYGDALHIESVSPQKGPW